MTVSRREKNIDIDLTLRISLAKFWIFSGTGPWGLAHSPAELAAAADMTRDDPRIEIVAAVSSTCEICLCDGTRLTPLGDTFTLETGPTRAAAAVRNITRLSGITGFLFIRRRAQMLSDEYATHRSFHLRGICTKLPTPGQCTLAFLTVYALKLCSFNWRHMARGDTFTIREIEAKAQPRR